MLTTKAKNLSVCEIGRLKKEITNLKEELAVNNSEIVHLKAVKNQFIGMVAHDLRNPLGVILSYSELLIDENEDKLTDVQKDFAGRIHSSTEFMLKLIEDLIDISQLDAGKLSLNAEILDIVSLITENIKRNKELAAKKNISIQIGCSEAIIYVYADANRLDQVFSNLLSNAIKFSDPGAAVNVQLSKVNDNVHIKVTDYGMGIASKALDKIFIPFEETPGKGTRGEKGTGLGLPIGKRIIEEHNGEIWVESVTGKGTSFTVSLPLK